MTATKADFDGIRPTVWLQNAANTAMDRIPWISCEMIRDDVGEMLCHARVRFGPAHYDGEKIVTEDHDYIDGGTKHPGPTALAYQYHDNVMLIPGQRVAITKNYDGSEVMFLGMLMNRVDTSSPDAVIWECVDDKWLLGGQGGITVRGALIASDNPKSDPEKVQFCSSFIPVFNPGGNFNCIGVKMKNPDDPEGDKILVPMFAPHAQRPKTWETDYAPPLAEGKLTAWTPRLALEYLCILLQIPNGTAMWGVQTNETWRTILPAAPTLARMVWSLQSIIDLHSYDPANPSIDLLDKRLNELTIQGKKALLAICDVLRALGTHTLRLSKDFVPGDPILMLGQSIVQITQKAIKDADTPSLDLVVPQSGSVAGYYDDPDHGEEVVASFALSDYAEDSAEATLVEGESVELEASFRYDPINKLLPDSQIVPAWSAKEQSAFLMIVNGGDATAEDDQPFCRYPPSPDKLDYQKTPPGDPGTWLIADGFSATPGHGGETARKRSPEAISLARKIFPLVFRTFRIYPTPTQLYGYGLMFSGTKFPQILIARPVEKMQGQSILQLVGTTAGAYESLIVQELQIRIRVRAFDDDGVEKWFPVLSDVDYSVDSGGLLTLKGISEEVDGYKWCLYVGSLLTNPLFVDLREFKINAVVKMDHRVYGYNDVSATAPIFSPSLRSAMGGPPMLYVDSGQSFREVHQVESEPSPFPTFQDVTGGTPPSTPISRILPPSTGREHALEAAKRRSFWAARIKRNGKFILPGIRAQYYAGLWLDNILIMGNPAQSAYALNAPIQSLTWDFLKQQTEIGGLMQDDQQ